MQFQVSFVTGCHYRRYLNAVAQDAERSTAYEEEFALNTKHRLLVNFSCASLQIISAVEPIKPLVTQPINAVCACLRISQNFQGP